MSSIIQRQPRPSIVIDSASGSEIDYPGSDVIIHKKDFLIHIKKLSLRSQSSDCATDCRKVLILPGSERFLLRSDLSFYPCRINQQ